MTEYQQLLQAIEQYYGSGSDQWAEIAKYGIASDQAEQILKQVPGVNIVKNANGSIRSYNLNATENVASSLEEAVNSNTPAVIKSVEIPANTGVETITSGTGEAIKQMTFKSGLSKAGSFVFGEITPALAATAVGITCGKLFDKGLYNLFPDFWDEHGMSTLNPDTWGDIIGTDSAGGRILNIILGTTPDGKTQTYMDENAFAYMAMYMAKKGVFDKEESAVYENDEIKSLNLSQYIDFPIKLSPQLFQTVYNNRFNEEDPNYVYTSVYSTSAPKVAVFKSTNIGGDGRIIFSSKNEVTWGVTDFASGLLKPIPSENESLYKTSIHNHEIYEIGIKENVYSLLVGALNISKVSIPDTVADDIAYALLYGDTVTTGGIDGISDQENAKIPDLSGATNPDDALNKLKEQYPDLWNNAVNHDVVQPDGSTKTYTYVPIAMPEIDQNGNPVSSSSNQANPQINPATAPEPLLKLITTLIQKDPPLNPPDTGSGDAPAAVPASGSASALYAIYNPTLSQINAFGAWLWSDNFVDQIKKLFNDPMQAIIGLHKVYATPATSGSKNIKVGYLDSGVSANAVSNQYTTIDCGTVTLSEYFHNVFDYSPYTQINLYLPFIGIVSLDNADVMRASIHIVYHVDVLSGACLAEVKVTRDGAGGTLYQYTGNASVTLPISSGSYMGIVTSIASIAGGIAGTIASGGAALPMLASAAGSALNARAKVEHSGGFSGNAGAMGGKIPYLIISRPQVALANNFQKYIGFPANYTTKLSNCAGYVKVLECHLENVNATNTELTEIESLLKEGVII